MRKNAKESQPVIFLKGKRAILRPVDESDIPLFVRWINDPDVRQFVTRIFPATVGHEREWLESMRKNTDTNVTLVIQVKKQPIGLMGLHGIDWRNRIATTGAMIGEKSYWGKGYGTDAKMALLDYAFNTLNLRKIMSRVKAFNVRSLAYSLHCGYTIEGRLRRQHFENGKYYDEFVLGLFKSQWLPYWEKHQGTKKRS